MQPATGQQRAHDDTRRGTRRGISRTEAGHRRLTARPEPELQRGERVGTAGAGTSGWSVDGPVEAASLGMPWKVGGIVSRSRDLSCYRGQQTARSAAVDLSGRSLQVGRGLPRPLCAVCNRGAAGGSQAPVTSHCSAVCALLLHVKPVTHCGGCAARPTGGAPAQAALARPGLCPPVVPGRFRVVLAAPGIPG